MVLSVPPLIGGFGGSWCNVRLGEDVGIFGVFTVQVAGQCGGSGSDSGAGGEGVGRATGSGRGRGVGVVCRMCGCVGSAEEGREEGSKVGRRLNHGGGRMGGMGGRRYGDGSVCSSVGGEVCVVSGVWKGWRVASGR